MNVNSPSPDDAPHWWRQLTSAQQESIQRVLGKDWQPSRSIDDAGERFDEVRRQIAEIEKRALGKLDDGNSGGSP